LIQLPTLSFLEVWKTKLMMVWLAHRFDCSSLFFILPSEVLLLIYHSQLLPELDPSRVSMSLALHNLFLVDGKLCAWGWNIHGQLGTGDTKNRIKPHILDLDGISSIACGRYHSMILNTKGVIWVWGYNDYGQLGLGDFTSRLTPQQLTFNFGVVISLISCGDRHSIALDNQGFVWIWGNNNKCQLGLGDKTNRNIPQKLNLKNISQIVCGDEYSMALDINGDIWSWGSNDYGQLGLGDTLDRNFPCKVKLSNVSTLAACFHSLAIDNQGQLWSWGFNESGRLGVGDETNHNLPQKVCINNAVSVSCGSHSAVIDKNGKTWVWGRNNVGQLGLGDFKSRFIQEPKLNVKNVSMVLSSVGLCCISPILILFVK